MCALALKAEQSGARGPCALGRGAPARGRGNACSRRPLRPTSAKLVRIYGGAALKHVPGAAEALPARLPRSVGVLGKKPAATGKQQHPLCTAPAWVRARAAGGARGCGFLLSGGGGAAGAAWDRAARRKRRAASSQGAPLCQNDSAQKAASACGCTGAAPHALSQRGCVGGSLARDVNTM